MKIVIAKLRENAKTPYKKHINDAGYDFMLLFMVES